MVKAKLSPEGLRAALIHELAHSLVALAWQIPVKSITLFIFGGVASIERDPDRPLAEFLIAIAGPLSSLGLSLSLGAVWFLAGGTAIESTFWSMLLWLAFINALLAVFNMLPGAPLDGGRIARAVFWRLGRDKLRYRMKQLELGREGPAAEAGRDGADLVVDDLEPGQREHQP